MEENYTILITLDRNLWEIILNFSPDRQNLLSDALEYPLTGEMEILQISAQETNIRIAVGKEQFIRLNKLCRRENNYINIIAGRQLTEYIINKIRNHTENALAENIETHRIHSNKLDR